MLNCVICICFASAVFNIGGRPTEVTADALSTSSNSTTADTNDTLSTFEFGTNDTLKNETTANDTLGKNNNDAYIEICIPEGESLPTIVEPHVDEEILDRMRHRWIPGGISIGIFVFFTVAATISTGMKTAKEAKEKKAIEDMPDVSDADFFQNDMMKKLQRKKKRNIFQRSLGPSKSKKFECYNKALSEYNQDLINQKLHALKHQHSSAENSQKSEDGSNPKLKLPDSVVSMQCPRITIEDDDSDSDDECGRKKDYGSPESPSGIRFEVTQHKEEEVIILRPPSMYSPMKYPDKYEIPSFQERSCSVEYEDVRSGMNSQLSTDTALTSVSSIGDNYLYDEPAETFPKTDLKSRLTRTFTMGDEPHERVPLTREQRKQRYRTWHEGFTTSFEEDPVETEKKEKLHDMIEHYVNNALESRGMAAGDVGNEVEERRDFVAPLRKGKKASRPHTWFPSGDNQMTDDSMTELVAKLMDLGPVPCYKGDTRRSSSSRSSPSSLYTEDDENMMLDELERRIIDEIDQEIIPPTDVMSLERLLMEVEAFCNEYSRDNTPVPAP